MQTILAIRRRKIATTLLAHIPVNVKKAGYEPSKVTAKRRKQKRRKIRKVRRKRNRGKMIFTMISCQEKPLKRRKISVNSCTAMLWWPHFSWSCIGISVIICWRFLWVVMQWLLVMFIRIMERISSDDFHASLIHSEILVISMYWFECF